MKIEQQEPEFRPVVITLESEMEAMVLSAALAKTSSSVEGQEDFLYGLYVALTDAADYTGTLEAIKTLTGIQVRRV